MGGEINLKFRSRSSEIDRSLKRIQEELKEITSHRKNSINQVLNFSIVLADKYLEEKEEEKKEKMSGIKSINQKIEEATEF